MKEENVKFQQSKFFFFFKILRILQNSPHKQTNGIPDWSLFH